MQSVLAEHRMADAERVLTRATELGDKLVVIGSSTGDIMSPGTTGRIATRIVDFIRPPTP
jgi:hypothetical protein